ncbi:DUF1236 domain-containing protein [Mesorhizobium sp. VNQ89]|uniref:DUF1236 domain-containing protein n=1 Tax=Mesorhizobium quangtriensis TaxID=3157709 RepID=UPI0032B7A40A
MNTLRTLITASVIAAGGAFAAHAQDTVIITPEEEVIVREYVKAHPVEVVERPSNFELVLGAVIPDVFKPGALQENTLPDRSYEYVVVDGRTALIDPATRQVVYILE